MDKDLSRSLRRHHIERLKKTRKFYWGRDKQNPLQPKQLGMVTQTPQICSCWVCRNARRNPKERLTIQELSHIEIAKS